ncbi:MAG: DUF6440 family protein [Firmicutes bacterium]|nr:DUF6440 family protein [Bacillota bacterium]
MAEKKSLSAVKEPKDHRLRKIAREADSGITETIREIYVDTQTGVQYLIVNTGTSVAVTLMLDAEGKPLVDKRI